MKSTPDVKERVGELLKERWRHGMGFDPDQASLEDLESRVQQWDQWIQEVGISGVGWDDFYQDNRNGRYTAEGHLAVDNPIAREWPTDKAILIVPEDVAIKLLFLGET